MLQWFIQWLLYYRYQQLCSQLCSIILFYCWVKSDEWRGFANCWRFYRYRIDYVRLIAVYWSFCKCCYCYWALRGSYYVSLGTWSSTCSEFSITFSWCCAVSNYNKLKLQRVWPSSLSFYCASYFYCIITIIAVLRSKPSHCHVCWRKRDEWCWNTWCWRSHSHWIRNVLISAVDKLWIILWNRALIENLYRCWGPIASHIIYLGIDNLISWDCDILCRCCTRRYNC